MLTIVVPADATNLTTLERAAAVLDLASADMAMVELLLSQASRAIVDYCRRPFGVETIRESFDTPSRDGSHLLSRGPLVELLEIKEGDTVLDSAGYGYDAGTGLIFGIDEFGSPYPWRWAGTFQVTYRAGYILPSDEPGAPEPTLPASVERAAIRLLGSFLSIRGRDPLVKSESVEGIGSTSWYVPGAASGLVDPEAEQLIAPFRRLF